MRPGRVFERRGLKKDDAYSLVSRFLVEYLRINEPALFGLTQPRLWAAVSIAAGIAIICRGRRHPRREGPLADGADGVEPQTLIEA